MQRSLLVILISIFFASQAYADPGRYQLVNAAYQFTNIRGEEHRIPVLILLDTSTGRMKVCESGQYPGAMLGRDSSKNYQIRSCNTDFESMVEMVGR